MTRDDITRMAQQCGFGGQARVTNLKRLEQFAALVAAAEREECARICNELWAIDGAHIAQKFAAAVRNRVDL